jgi:hypothetical protein
VVIGAKDGETVEIKKGISQGDEILLVSAEAKNQPENTGQ